MKVLLAGPIETKALANAIEVDLGDLPSGTTQTPLGPLTAGLIAAGHDVHVVTLDPHVKSVEEFRRGALTLTYCPIRAEPIYRARVRSRDLFAREIAYLESVMRHSDAEVVHANWTYEYAEAALRSQRPMLATMHDLGWSILSMYRDPYRLMRLVMKYRAMVRLRTVTAVAPFMAKKAWQYGYFGHVDVIPNPISPADISPKHVSKPVIVTIGNSGRGKNVAASVKAFAQVQQFAPDAELHLFGPGLGNDGPFGASGGNVHCHGNVPHGELMAFLEGHATILVHPSRTEACPVILGEAKMRGIPVIAGERAGGVPYVVGKAGGLLVDIESPAAIARAVTEVLSDPALYQELQQAGHNDAMERFLLSQVTAEYVKVYERVIRAY